MALVLGGCVSLGGVYGQTSSGSSGTSDASGGDSGETEESGTEPDGGDTGESGRVEDADPVVSGSRPGDADAPFFRVTEDYWVQTPWFGVSSIIVMIRRTLPPTRIVVPPESLLASVMRPVDNVVPALPADHRLDRIRININFHMGDVPPFFDPERYANPEDYR
ncbi:MAG: hypothetical protein PF508_09820 [Spirochaeta sp.]|nr:hypothetical protein [Spirochaeta sp.]